MSLRVDVLIFRPLLKRYFIANPNIPPTIKPIKPQIMGPQERPIIQTVYLFHNNVAAAEQDMPIT